MKNLITKTFRAGFVFAVVVFAITNTALAYAVIIPSGVTEITTTTAVLNGQISNQGENSSGWFELSDNPSLYPASIVGKNSFMGSGSLIANLDNLNPGETYYYRIAVVSRPVFGSAEAPVYSDIMSFQTRPSFTVSSALTQIGNNGAGAQSTSSNSSGKNTNTQSSTNGSASKSSSTNGTKEGSNTTTSNTNTTNGSANGFSNSNSASVIGAGDGILPTTLIGWIALLIALLVVILIIRLIYEESEKRKKAKAAKKLMDEAKAAAAKEEASGIK